jgi:hypothetical protein
MQHTVCLEHRGVPQVLGGCGAGAFQTPQNRNLIYQKFYVISPFSRNQPLKSAEDYYVRILKNKLTKLKKKTRSQGTVTETWNV